MTYNEKKSLYESIMKDIAKTVKRQLNEAGVRSFKDGDLISKEDAEQIARDRDIAERNNDWNEFFKKYPKLLNQIKNIGKPKYSNLAPADSNLKSGFFVARMFEENDEPIKTIHSIAFGIKGNSYDETMIYYSAFVNATAINLSELFIKIIPQTPRAEWIQWYNKSTNEMQDQIDEVSENIYKSCIRNSKGILDVAEKMKAFAEKSGFEFTYKVFYSK